MSGIRLNSKDIYRIEVNDEGECIEFDLRDIGLRTKCITALNEIEKIQKKYNEIFKEINKEKTTIKSENDDIEKILNDNKFKSYTEAETNMFQEMRDAMDVFLGKGACQKIFGDRNYYEMYADLIDELSKPRKELKGKSHLDMLNLKSDQINKRIKQKYNKVVKNVI